MKYFHGAGRNGPYFEGWYFKHQSPEGAALALIPALHIDRSGRRSASLQVLTDSGSWWLEYPDAGLRACEQDLQIQLDRSSFGRRGVQVQVEREGLSLHGALRYGPFTPIRSDIMGPFRFFAGMECAHGVVSMGHPLMGTLTLNGTAMDFSGGTGYVETDRGRSFPETYLWTQCVWPGPRGGSLMLSVATIPLPVGRFTGCICAIVYGGREYRLATYLGARAVAWSPAGAEIRQGKYRLTVELLAGQGRTLRAPVEGSMGRAIRESLCARLRYSFWSGGTLLFSHTDPCASFEYADRSAGQPEPAAG